MNSLEKYKFWLEDSYFDKETHTELLRIKDDPKEIEERFYKDLEFGTGGLRGIMGAGTNRMNIYTVRKASQGVANYVNKRYGRGNSLGIVIAYDSRYKSPEFALEAAKVFAGNGIKAYLFDELRPTPELSFAVRRLNASAGIVVTASHNTKEYNGYKVYGEDGAQLSLKDSDAVLEEIEKIENFSDILVTDEGEAIEKGLLEFIGKRIDDDYINRLKSLCVNPDLIKEHAKDFKIIYTPFHGTGNKLVRRILSEIGFGGVIVVKEQELPDPQFSTVKSPNPEDREAFKIAIELAKKENVDIIIGTDPDCDRMGVVVRNGQGEYTALTGNQIGCLMLEYVLSQKSRKGDLPPNAFVVTTIVSTGLAGAITDKYGVELVEVLTGFKFIGEQIKLLDEFGDKKFIFGFEESYGYLAGTFSRDKDGVVASMLIAETAAYYKSRGMSLYDGLQEIFNRYGYFIEDTNSFALAGKEGIEKINGTMAILRESMSSRFGSAGVEAVRDYLASMRYILETNETYPLFLPRSDVLYYELKDGSWFCVRPSGTEPKIKVYFGVSAENAGAAESKARNLKDAVLGEIKELLYG